MESLRESVRSGNPDAQIDKQTTHPQCKPWRSKLKVLIVTTALWGVIPRQFAEWFVRIGGVTHD